MNCEWGDGFGRDVKRLVKKYRSLHSDVEELCAVLAVGRPKPRRRHAARLKQFGSVSIWKMRLSCRFLKNDSLRVVFAYREGGGGVEFLELFYKGDKEREDESRYQHYLEAVH